MSEAGADLLQQLEDILESDPLIDEVGFIHPSQFDLLNEESGISGNSSDEAISQATKRTASSEGCSKQKNKNFWNKDHKLGISTSILLPLYKAAKLAFMTAFKQYKMCGDQSNEVGNCLPASSSCDDLQSILMRHSRSLLLLSCDFMTAWNCRKLVVSKEKQHSMLLDELHLFVFVLSYSPKSEQAWNHRLGSPATSNMDVKAESKVEEPKFLFEAKTVQRMELLVLSTLQCRMNPVTPISFLEHIVRRIGLKTLLHWEFLWKGASVFFFRSFPIQGSWVISLLH